MALVWKDRVKETSTTTGTGTYTLAGAVAGFQAFSAIGNANTCYYAAFDSATGAWEVGLGTYTLSGTTLARTSILASSNAGSAVSWAAGTRNIWNDLPAGFAATLAVALGKVLTVNNTITLTGTDGTTITLPSTSATMARTDAGQTFTGAQAFLALLDLSGAAAGQVAFPASQNASAGANTLDDYEEGTFTPTMAGATTAGTGTYSLQVGHYIKVGALVFYDFNLQWSAHTGTGTITFPGLPFQNSSTIDAAVSVFFANLTFASTFVIARINTNDNVVIPSTVATGAGFSNIAMDTAAVFESSGTYGVV